MKCRITILLTAALVALSTTGAAGAATVTKVYSSGDLNVPIPEDVTLANPNLATSDVTVPEAGTVVDVNVRVRVNHPYDQDVALALVAPSGTVVVLVAGAGLDGDNFGSGPSDCSGSFTGFDDSAVTSIQEGTAPFAGSFKPAQPLTALSGSPVRGHWILAAADVESPDAGVLLCWQLEITYEPPGTDLAVSLSDSPDPAKAGKTIKYTVTVKNAGPGRATGVRVTDTLPAGATFVSASWSKGTCSRSGRRVVCAVGDLASGASAKITITVRAPARAGKLTDSASVRADQVDPKASNDNAHAQTTVRKA